METIKKNLEERSKKSIAVLKEDLNTVRAVSYTHLDVYKRQV